jgi:DtxR family Mn-dependent transcriptional regulator
VNEEVAHKDSCLMEHLMSTETREKFFNFMKSLTNDEFKKNTFTTSFDFSQFDHQHDFEEIQKGDTYLKSE